MRILEVVEWWRAILAFETLRYVTSAPNALRHCLSCEALDSHDAFTLYVQAIRQKTKEIFFSSPGSRSNLRYKFKCFFLVE